MGYDDTQSALIINNSHFSFTGKLTTSEGNIIGVEEARRGMCIDFFVAGFWPSQFKYENTADEWIYLCYLIRLA